MKATCVLAAASIAFPLLACSAPPGGATSPDERTGAAVPASADPRVASYLESLYRASDVRHSFRSRMGDEIDCVAVESEPGVRDLLAKGMTLDEILAPFGEPDPKARPDAETSPPGDAYFTGDADEDGAARACPALTVAHVRITPERIAKAGGVDRYLAAKTRSLGAITPDTNPVGGGLNPGSPPDYTDAHVYAYQSPPSGSYVYGGTGILTITADTPSTFSNYDPDFTLEQIWVAASGPSGAQTVEVGAKTSVEDNGPYLFVGATANGYTQFCENGNPSGTGPCVTWIGNPAATLALQQYLPISTPGGTQHELLVDVQSRCVTHAILQPAVCVWDVYASVDGAAETLLGYFPASAYGSGPLGSGYATYFEAGGEVKDDSGSFADVDMGEGPLVIYGYLGSPSASYGQNAYVRNFGYYASQCSSFYGVIRGCTYVPTQSPATVYTTNSVFAYNTTAAAGASTWTNWFYFGNTVFQRVFY